MNLNCVLTVHSIFPETTLKIMVLQVCVMGTKVTLTLLGYLVIPGRPLTALPPTTFQIPGGEKRKEKNIS